MGWRWAYHVTALSPGFSTCARAWSSSAFPKVALCNVTHRTLTSVASLWNHCTCHPQVEVAPAQRHLFELCKTQKPLFLRNPKWPTMALVFSGRALEETSEHISVCPGDKSGLANTILGYSQPHVNQNALPSSILVFNILFGKKKKGFHLLKANTVKSTGIMVIA